MHTPHPCTRHTHAPHPASIYPSTHTMRGGGMTLSAAGNLASE